MIRRTSPRSAVAAEVERKLEKKMLLLKFEHSSSAASKTSPPEPQQKLITSLEYKRSILSLRNKVRNNEVLEFENPIIFVLYGPPDSPTEQYAEYLSLKSGIPVLYPNDYLYNTHKGINDTIKHSSSKILNVSSRQLRKMNSSVVVDPTRAALSDLFRNDDRFKKGWIMYEYPDSAAEMRYFRTELFEGVQIAMLFFEMDSETLAAQLHKWDRYVNIARTKSYHLCVNPPNSLSKGKNDILFTSDEISSELCDLLDDETGEPLLKLAEDTVDAYKARLAKFEITKIPLYYSNETISHVIPGGSKAAVERETLKALYSIHESNLKEKFSLATTME